MNKRPKIEINYNQENKYRNEIEEVFRMYLNKKVTFGIVLNRLELKRIIKIKEPEEDLK